MKIVLIVALVLRLIAIDQSLWLDEAISANVAKTPINLIVRNFSIADFHPPIHYWFLNIWTKIVGNNVAGLRLSSVLFSLVTIYFVYLIGKKIKNKNTGILAAWFLAVNPLFVFYSQELRMYSMATMWLTIGFFYFLKIRSAPLINSGQDSLRANWKQLIIFNLMMALAFGSFYGSIFLIASLAIYWLIKKEYKLFWLTNIGTGLAILALTPLLLIQIKNSQAMLLEVVNWSLVLGKVNLKNLLMIPLKFSVGRISLNPKILYYLIGGSWTLILFLIALKNKKETGFLRIFLIVPIILAMIFSIKSPLLQYFRFLYLIPILALILAINATKLWQKTLVGGGFLVFSLIYLLNPNFYREDWKGVVNEISDGRSQMSDKTIYMIGSFGDPVRYYGPDIKISDIRSQIEGKEILVIPYGEAIHGINSEEKLESLGYKRVDKKNFREVTIETWNKNP